MAAPKGGHIQRRTLQRQMADDKELADKVEQAKQVARQELLEAREVPATLSSVFPPQARPDKPRVAGPCLKARAAAKIWMQS